MGRDWQEMEKDSITRQKESVVFCVVKEEKDLQAHSLSVLLAIAI